MDKKYTEMTNAEFIEKIKQECENDEELKEEINEITSIFIRAIAKGYPNFENSEEFKNEIETTITDNQKHN